MRADSEFREPAVRQAEDEFIRAVKDMRPLIEGHAAENEETSTISREVIDALIARGVFRMAAPRRVGGLGMSCYAMAHVVAEIAKACPSTGWVVTITNTCTWMAARMSPEAQKRVFAQHVPIVCLPNSGAGTLTAEGGAYRVSGSWSYGSGCHFSDWTMVPASTADGRPHMVIIPSGDLQLVRSWNAAGLKGTGSDTVVAKAVRVTPDQFCPVEVLWNPMMGQAEASENFPSASLDPVIYARAKGLGVLLGMAEGLLEAVMTLRKKPITLSTYVNRDSSQVWQTRLGEAAAQIGMVRTAMDALSRTVDIAGRERRLLDYDERARIRADCALMVDMLKTAAASLMNLAGSSSFLSSAAPQRYWRDLNVGASHILYNTDICYEVFGKRLLGIEPNILPEQLT